MTVRMYALGVLLVGAMAACDSDEGRAPAPTLAPIESAGVPVASGRHLTSAAELYKQATAWMNDESFAGEMGMSMQATEPDAGSEEPDPSFFEPAGFEAFIDGFRDILEEDMLVDEQIEEESTLEIVYLMDPQRLCGDDAECVDLWTEVPLRLRATSWGEGQVNLSFLFGEARHEPLIVELSEARIGVTADLGAAAKSWKLVSAAMDQPPVDAELGSVSGRVQLSLVRTGDRAVELSLKVQEALRFDGQIDGTPASFELGPSTLSVGFDGVQQTMTMLTSLGRAQLSAPYQLLADLVGGGEECTGYLDDNGEYIAECQEVAAPEVTGTIGLDLGGASGSVTLAETDRSLVFRGVGLGTTTSRLTLDDQTLVGLDLNPATGRKLDLELFGSEELTIRVTPGLDLSVEMHLALLSELDKDLARGWWADETLHLDLGGSERPSVTLVEDGVRIDDGRLLLESRAMPELNLSASAGQCVLGEEIADDGEDPHPFEALSVGACK